MQGWKKGVKMRLQNMFKKTGERENPVRKGRLRRRPEAPEGLLKKCNKCGAAILSEEAFYDGKHGVCSRREDHPGGGTCHK